MDFTTHYCLTRQDLEQRSWNLTEELFKLSERLIRLLRPSGTHRREEFFAIRSQCTEVKANLSEAHFRLQSHRSQHGC